jgi:hypothetical protein
VRTEPVLAMAVGNDVLCGSVDFLGKHRRTGQYYILDWKCTGKELKPTADGAFGWGTGAFDGMENLPFHHYSLQLHMYRLMFQSPGYDLTIPVENLLLVRFHRDTADGSFEVVPCAEYSAMAQELLDNYPTYLQLSTEHEQQQADIDKWMAGE